MFIRMIRGVGEFKVFVAQAAGWRGSPGAPRHARSKQGTSKRQPIPSPTFTPPTTRLIAIARLLPGSGFLQLVALLSTPLGTVQDLVTVDLSHVSHVNINKTSQHLSERTNQTATLDTDNNYTI
jgi:hypothetical protein